MVRDSQILSIQVCEPTPFLTLHKSLAFNTGILSAILYCDPPRDISTNRAYVNLKDGEMHPPPRLNERKHVLLCAPRYNPSAQLLVYIRHCVQ